MINETFQGRLTKFGTKTTADGDVVAEFTIQHKDEQPTQYFLDALSKEFNNDINKCMDYTEWKSISFDVEGVHVQLTIDDVEDMKMSELKQFIIDHPSVLKRPIILDGEKMQVGYNEEEIRVFIPKRLRELIMGIDCPIGETCDYQTALKRYFDEMQTEELNS